MLQFLFLCDPLRYVDEGEATKENSGGADWVLAMASMYLRHSAQLFRSESSSTNSNSLS